ncbi:MAG TPA: 5-(carboxyamino)imidazole ribonucleotide synthase [Nitrospira sp.]
MIAPGAVLGVLGGGQLGAMFAAAARRMGYDIAVWDPDSDAPAHRLAQHSFTRPFTDQSAFDEFSTRVSVVTYEWENVPSSLCRELEQRKPVRPSSGILRLIQNRINQKSYLSAQGFGVPPFCPVSTIDQLGRAIEQVGYPVVCKTATAGYDGKGQWKAKNEAELSDVRKAMVESIARGTSWIVESLVPFQRELSVLVARGGDGISVIYPIAENEHDDGILRMTIVPANIASPLAEGAGKLARQVIERLDGIGVFCVELFLLPDGELLINEIAPRPHNSAHYTLDACSVSQFEQQVRAICGLPLGEVRLFSSAAMINLIGNDAIKVTDREECRALLAIPGAKLHLYGKRTVRPRRKMGHVTFLASDANTARKQANELCDRLANTDL